MEGANYCQCRGASGAGGGTATSCANPHGLYAFDERRVREHALLVLYPQWREGEEGGEEPWTEGGEELTPPLSSAAYSPASLHSASPSLSSQSSQSELRTAAPSFLPFRSHSFSYHPHTQHSSPAFAAAQAGGGDGGWGAGIGAVPPLRPSLSRRSSRVSPPSSPLIAQHLRALQLLREQQRP